MENEAEGGVQDGSRVLIWVPGWLVADMHTVTVFFPLSHTALNI